MKFRPLINKFNTAKKGERKKMKTGKVQNKDINTRHA